MKPNPYSPHGKLIDIGSHRLHLHALGAGSPAVILEAGGLSWCLDWHLVQTEVAKFTRACSYDRAGVGWSDPGPKPRSSAQIVSELHSLLENAEILPPYILVGASFGGHTARLFAHQYPTEVAGVILLDARHEAINEKMPPAWHKYEKSGAGMLFGMLLASRAGALKFLSRFIGEKAAPPILQKLPAELRPAYLKVGFQPKFFQANLDEFAAIANSDRQLSKTGTLGNIPLTVVRHGLPKMFVNMPTAQAQQAEQVWEELQNDLARLSSKSRLLVAEQSGHNIPVEQPGLVVDTIRSMVETTRGVTKTA
jgi:pimeloyl-ACP methyl ester carboxylesterase